MDTKILSFICGKEMSPEGPNILLNLQVSLGK